MPDLLADLRFALRELHDPRIADRRPSQASKAI